MKRMLSSLFAVGIDVLRTTLSDTGVLLAQLGNVTSENTETDEAEWWQHVGFLSRPPKADEGKEACQVIAIRRSDRDAVVASRDLRGIQLAGNIKEGETIVYAPGADGKAQARAILKADGSINLFTTDTNDDSGNSVYFRVAKDGFHWVAPWGTIRFDATGFHLRHASGARLDLGGIGGLSLPAPLPNIASYASLSAGMVTAGGAINALNGAPDASPAAKSAPVVAFCTDVAAAVGLLGASATLTGPQAAAAAAACSAVAASATGLAASISSGTMV